MLPSNDSSRVRLDGLDAMCQVSGTTFVFLLIEEVHLDLSGVSTWGSCKEEKSSSSGTGGAASVIAGAN